MEAWLGSAVVRDVTDVPRKRRCTEQGLGETYAGKGYLRYETALGRDDRDY